MVDSKIVNIYRFLINVVSKMINNIVFIIFYWNKCCNELDLGGEMEWFDYFWSGLDYFKGI